jgi:hypothetical protein
MDLENITIIILGLMLSIYVCNDYIIPFITGTPASNMLEEFTSQYSSLASSLSSSGNSKTAAFDTNWYLREPNKPIIRNNKIALPIISYGFYEIGGYDDLVGTYIRHHIYPIEPQQLETGLDTIYKFINEDIDMAFINEELLARFIKQDCKYLTRYIIEQLGLSETYDLSKPENISRLYPSINFSVLGVGYHVNPLLIVNNFSNITQFVDIQTKIIGVLEDGYYYFMKVCSAYQLDISKLSIERHPHLESLLDKFRTNKYDGIFILAHPKNKQLLKLSLDMKVRFIHIQKHQSPTDARSNLANLVADQQGTNNKEPPPPPDMNRQQIYSKTLMDDLGTVNNKETFNSLMKKYFHHLEPYVADLNKFHKSGNMYSYLETYSSRMILCIRDDIPRERQKYITRNYVNNLNKIRDRIDREEFIPQLDNFSSLEFRYEELLGFDKVIPLAEGAKDVYKEEGMIYYENDSRCKL